MKLKDILLKRRKLYNIAAGSRKEILARLKKHYTLTVEYLGMINSGESADGSSTSGDWFIHVLVRDDKTISAYFPQTIVDQSKAVIESWEANQSRRGMEAYHAHPEVQERKIPWFENMDLYDNLNKTLTIDKMIEVEAKATYIPPYAHDTIAMDYFKRIGIHPDTLKIYEKKKDLEERMIEHLEKK